MNHIALAIFFLISSSYSYAESNGASICHFVQESATIVKADCCGGSLCNMEFDCGGEVKNITCPVVEGKCPTDTDCLRQSFPQVDTVVCQSMNQVFGYTSAGPMGYTADEVKKILAKRGEDYTNDSKKRIAGLNNLGFGIDRLQKTLGGLVDRLNSIGEIKPIENSSPEDVLRLLAQQRAKYEMLKSDAQLLQKKLHIENNYVRSVLGQRNLDLISSFEKNVEQTQEGLRAIIDSATQSQQYLDQTMDAVNKVIIEKMSQEMIAEYDRQLATNNAEQILVSMVLSFETNMTKVHGDYFKLGREKDPKNKRELLKSIDGRVRASESLFANLPAIIPVMPNSTFKKDFDKMMNDVRSSMDKMKKAQTEAYILLTDTQEGRGKMEFSFKLDEKLGSILEDDPSNERKDTFIGTNSHDGNDSVFGLHHVKFCMGENGCTGDFSENFSLLGTDALGARIYRFADKVFIENDSFIRVVDQRYYDSFMGKQVGGFVLSPAIFSAADGVSDAANYFVRKVDEEDNKIAAQADVVNQKQQFYNALIAQARKKNPNASQSTLNYSAWVVSEYETNSALQSDLLFQMSYNYALYELGLIEESDCDERAKELSREIGTWLAPGPGLGAGFAIFEEVLATGIAREEALAVSKGALPAILDAARDLGAYDKKGVKSVTSVFQKMLGPSKLAAADDVKKLATSLKGMPIEEAERLVNMWDKATFPNLAENLQYHANTHGFGNNLPKYLRKAANFNFKGATKNIVNDGLGTVRWERMSSGEFIEMRNGKIITYGFNPR